MIAETRAPVGNITGMPVRGNDFFDRERELERTWQRLRTDNILLLAPRRVGKTSLMHRLADQSAAKGFRALYVNVQDAPTELEFAEKLYRRIEEFDPKHRALRALARGKLGRFFKRVRKAGAWGASLELESGREQWSDIVEALITALSEHTVAGERWLLLIDELPVFVLRLLKADPDGTRARAFLNWFRALRIDPAASDRVRWFLAGSIGLDTVVRRKNLGDTINDLFILSDFGAFPADVAQAFLAELARGKGVSLSLEVRAHVLSRAGWPIPFHVQLLFAELENVTDGFKRLASCEDVDRAYETLLAPAKRAHFDYWKQRLHEELWPPDDAFAVELLDAAALDEHGVTEQTLDGVLARRITEPSERTVRLHELLDILQSDGYLVRHVGRYRFQSSLLREFWKRRIAR